MAILPMGIFLQKPAFDLDDPRTTLYHREVILSKPFLKKLYTEWYGQFIKAVPAGGKLLEIGSGGGFLKQVFPAAITSDIMPLENCDTCFSAEEMPFKDGELDAIVMLNVFHHIPDPSRFLKEAARTLKKGGRIVMVEPANTVWSRFVYNRFHHEPFNPKGGWQIDSSGPLSGANGALPWIYFKRDREKFEKEFPQLRLEKFKSHTPLRYLISGGLTMKQLVPSWSFGFFSGCEWLISPLAPLTGMFVTVEISKAE